MNRKLVVFVPPNALNAVRDAVFAAGAGRIGDYERCSWYTDGHRHVPRRRGDESRRSARPASSSASTSTGSRRCSPRRRQDAVVAALRAAHPYEEPAFDVYALL